MPWAVGGALRGLVVWLVVVGVGVAAAVAVVVLVDVGADGPKRHVDGLVGGVEQLDVFVVVDTDVFVLVVFVSDEFALFVTSVGS